MSPPFQLGFARVYSTFARAGLHEQVTFIGGGKLGLPDNAIVAFALGCDMVNVAREAMLAIGCIQAQNCHTDTCPTGVATQNAWLAHGLDPALKSVWAATYIGTLRRDLRKVAEACGVEHPGLIDTSAVEVLTGRTASRPCSRSTTTSRVGVAVGGRPGRHRAADDRPSAAGRQCPSVLKRSRLSHSPLLPEEDSRTVERGRGAGATQVATQPPTSP